MTASTYAIVAPAIGIAQTWVIGMSWTPSSKATDHLAMRLRSQRLMPNIQISWGPL